MAKAFLSHSSAQKILVTSIADKLGLDNCVLDKYHFQPGEPTLQEIFKTIDESDLFVLFLSNEALNSDWVKNEIEYANTLQNSMVKRRLLLFLIDKSISHTDPRIPNWLKDHYNLKPITDGVLLYKKIDSKLRDIDIEKYPHIKAKEEIFVGRNDLMDEFESKYYNLENTKPTCIIASGLEEVGRKKFIKHALDAVKKANKFHKLISITLSSRDSIEDFILRIEDQNSKPPEEILGKVKKMDLAAKKNYAKELLETFRDINEILFVIDKGCIVQANKKFASWFEEMIAEPGFKNTIMYPICRTDNVFN